MLFPNLRDGSYLRKKSDARRYMTWTYGKWLKITQQYLWEAFPLQCKQYINTTGYLMLLKKINSLCPFSYLVFSSRNLQLYRTTYFFRRGLHDMNFFQNSVSVIVVQWCYDRRASPQCIWGQTALKLQWRAGQTCVRYPLLCTNEQFQSPAWQRTSLLDNIQQPGDRKLLVRLIATTHTPM